MLSLLPLLTLLLSAAHAEPEMIRETFQTYLRYASLPVPTPSASQLAKLDAGEVVKMEISGGESAPDGAMVLVVSSLSRVALWLGSADSHGDEPHIIAHHLPLQGGEMFRWYGLVDLPRPFSDRHFLIRTVINRRLPAAQPGMWERAWDLEAGGRETMRAVVAQGGVQGLSLETFDAAIYTPSNRGAWLFLDLPDGRTLFGYHAVSSLGGEIPDGLVTRYVFWGLDEVVKSVVERAQKVAQHYRGSHAPILGGDGQPIPRFP